MLLKIPQVGITGFYTVKLPFIIQNVEYTCTNVSLITDLVKNNIDVFNLYFAPIGLTQDDFNTCVNNKDLIVTLTSTDNFILTLPNSYIVSTPSEATVNYRHFVLSIDLSYLPEDVDLKQLDIDLRDVIYSRIGIHGNTIVHKLPNAKKVRISEAEQNELLRLALASNAISFYAGMVTAEETAAVLQQRVNDLETILVNSY